MNDTILVLISSIRRDLAIIAEIYAHLERYPLQPDTDADTLIIIKRSHCKQSIFISSSSFSPSCTT
jgi:hypothetical protein